MPGSDCPSCDESTLEANFAVGLVSVAGLALAGVLAIALAITANRKLWVAIAGAALVAATCIVVQLSL